MGVDDDEDAVADSDDDADVDDDADDDVTTKSMLLFIY